MMEQKMPEPFIALRTDERMNIGKIKWTPKEIKAKRDSRGVAWIPYSGSMEGATLYAHVHPIRQKMCMEGPYCQVCGTSLAASNNIPWLLNGLSDPTLSELAENNYAPFDTITAPTCRNCQRAAAEMCPHMVANPETPRLLVKRYHVWGAFGNWHHTETDIENNIAVRFGTPEARTVLPHFIGAQLVVSIDRYKIVTKA